MHTLKKEFGHREMWLEFRVSRDGRTVTITRCEGKAVYCRDSLPIDAAQWLGEVVTTQRQT